MPACASDNSFSAGEGHVRYKSGVAVCRWIMSVAGSQSRSYLLFYSVREFLLILIQQNGARAGGAAIAVRVCEHVSVWALSPVP